MAKSLVFMCLLSFVLLIHNIDASNEFVVESTRKCKQWKEISRLRFGNTTAYVYEAEKSWVVKVKQEYYIICDANDGYLLVKLNKPGPKYSITGTIAENSNKIIIHVIGGHTDIINEDFVTGLLSGLIFFIVMAIVICVAMLSRESKEPEKQKKLEELKKLEKKCDESIDTQQQESRNS